MNIEFDLIINYLKNQNISHTILGSHQRERLVIASIFTPCDNGFYYWSGADLNLEVTKSVILTSKIVKRSASNTLIIIEGDPQEIYYHILDYYFKRKSTGEISNFSIIGDTVTLGNNVQVEAFSILEDCIIEDNVVIGSSCRVHPNSIIRRDSIIESGSIIGAQGVAWTWSNGPTERIVQPQLGGVVIGASCFIGAQTVVVRGSLNENTEVGDFTLMAPGGRIGHGTIIGKFVHFANGVITGGNSKIGDYSFIGSGAVLRPKVQVCERTIVGAGSVVVRNQEVPGKTLMGVPAKETETKEQPSGMPKPKK